MILFNLKMPLFIERIKLLVSLAIRLAILVLLFLVLNPSACKKEDVGKCTISTHSGDKQVYDDVSLEECQNIFGNTIGGKGWEWEPKN